MSLVSGKWNYIYKHLLLLIILLGSYSVSAQKKSFTENELEINSNKTYQSSYLNLNSLTNGKRIYLRNQNGTFRIQNNNNDNSISIDLGNTITMHDKVKVASGMELFGSIDFNSGFSLNSKGTYLKTLNVPFSSNAREILEIGNIEFDSIRIKTYNFSGLLGTAALLNADDLIQLNAQGKLPALDGSLLTNLNLSTTISDGSITSDKIADGTISSTDVNSIEVSKITGLGSAALLEANNGANNLVKLDESGKLPSLDGSMLTNVVATEVDFGEGVESGSFKLNISGNKMQFQYADGVGDFKNSFYVNQSGNSHFANTVWIDNPTGGQGLTVSDGAIQVNKGSLKLNNGNIMVLEGTDQRGWVLGGINNSNRNESYLTPHNGTNQLFDNQLLFDFIGNQWQVEGDFMSSGSISATGFDGDGSQLTNLDISQVSGFGTAAALDAGVGADQLVQLDASGKLPALDGSNLTNISLSAGTPINPNQIEIGTSLWDPLAMDLVFGSSQYLFYEGAISLNNTEISVTGGSLDISSGTVTAQDFTVDDGVASPYSVADRLDILSENFFVDEYSGDPGVEASIFRAGAVEAIGEKLSLNVMPSYDQKGYINLARKDDYDIRYHQIEMQTSPDPANGYIKFKLHEGGANAPFTGLTDVMTLKATGDVDVNGNMAASSFIGDGSQLTGIYGTSSNMFKINSGENASNAELEFFTTGAQWSIRNSGSALDVLGGTSLGAASGVFSFRPSGDFHVPGTIYADKIQVNTVVNNQVSTTSGDFTVNDGNFTVLGSDGNVKFAVLPNTWIPQTIFMTQLDVRKTIYANSTSVDGYAIISAGAVHIGPHGGNHLLSSTASLEDVYLFVEEGIATEDMTYIFAEDWDEWQGKRI